MIKKKSIVESENNGKEGMWTEYKMYYNSTKVWFGHLDSRQNKDQAANKCMKSKMRNDGNLEKIMTG